MSATQPSLISSANEFVNRVIYIDLNDKKNFTSSKQSNIQKKLTEMMQDRGWYPKPPRTCSRIFYKRDDSANWRPEEEVQEAIDATQKLHRQADFQFAVLRPVCVTDDLTDDTFGNLFDGLD
ncbi:unnamed protein product [Auanema sp. JU1783]|nr:unnamed protein product [Auanema sp. JU1783]